jgi:hypothetical protein
MAKLRRSSRLASPRRAVTRVPRAPPPPRVKLGMRFVTAHTMVVAGAFILLAAAALSGELKAAVADDAFEGRKSEPRRFYCDGWVHACLGARCRSMGQAPQAPQARASPARPTATSSRQRGSCLAW